MADMFVTSPRISVAASAQPLATLPPVHTANPSATLRKDEFVRAPNRSAASAPRPAMAGGEPVVAVMDERQATAWLARLSDEQRAMLDLKQQALDEAVKRERALGLFAPGAEDNLVTYEMLTHAEEALRTGGTYLRQQGPGLSALAAAMASDIGLTSPGTAEQRPLRAKFEAQRAAVCYQDLLEKDLEATLMEMLSKV